MCLVTQSCPTLCDPTDCSQRGSSVHGIFQARVLEWLPFPSPGDAPDPGSNPGLPHYRQMLYHLRHKYPKENFKRDEQARIHIKHSNCAKHYIAINSNVTITPLEIVGFIKSK